MGLAITALNGRAPLLRQSALLVLILGLLLSALAWHIAARRTNTEASRDFRQASQHIARLVEERMLRALDLVAGFRGLFSVDQNINRAEFHDHFQSLRLPERFPGVIALQYSPLVPAAGKEAFEAAVRADTSLDPRGYPDYAIHPAGKREFYTPVLFNEPMAGNEAAFGHDTAAEPGRRRVMERTRDTGEPVASPLLFLLQGETGFVIRHAIYQREAPLWTEAQRRTAFLGQVSGMFRATDLLSPLLEEHLKGYRIRVEDRGDTREGQGPAALLFDSRSSQAAPEEEFQAERLETMLKVAGRLWVVEVSRPAGLPHLMPGPASVLLAGVTLTLLAGWLLHSTARHSENTALIAARLAHEATHDALTGLPNRLLLEQRLKAALDTAKRSQGRLALLFIDLDRFKAINDSLGHEAGDVVLRQVALRLRGALRPTDTVARLGGDEFVVLLLSLPAGGTWRGVADRILALITQPMTYGEHRLAVGASLGAALYPDHGAEAAALLRHADGLMYAAKRGGSLATTPSSLPGRAG